MSANFRLTRSQNTRAIGQQFVTRDQNIIHLVTDVVNPAARVLVQIARDGRVVTQGIKQFDLCVRQFNKNNRYAMIWLVLWRIDLGPQSACVLRGGRLKIWHRYCDMV